tara:strand:- start:507 stop:974 length:468 start_codon:yes stop_codon:yes gene_type:complete
VIESKFATEQLRRLQGLSFFPTEAPAVRELRLSIEAAASDAIAVRVVGRWLEESTDAPKPAQLRNLLYAENELHRETVGKCVVCGGVGAVTVWKLVTYRGNSFTVQAAKTLECKDYEEAMDYTRRLVAWQEENPSANQQTVLSAAERCGCVGGEG